MNARTTIFLTCLLSASLAFPGYALAKDNDIDQRRIDAEVDNTEENVANTVDTDQIVGHGTSASIASCQFIVAAEVSVAALATSTALAVISDEDEVTITAARPAESTNLREHLDAELSTSICTAPLGPILVDLTTSTGWGAASPHGTLSDAVLALQGGNGGGYNGRPENDIDQRRVETDVELDDNVHNEWFSDQESDGNSAISASNCQTLVAARVSILGMALASARGSIEDSDQVTITEAPGPARVADFDFSEVGPESETLMVDNNHTADSSCTQTIESITILVRPDSSTLPPRS